MSQLEYKEGVYSSKVSVSSDENDQAIVGKVDKRPTMNLQINKSPYVSGDSMSLESPAISP